MSNSSSFNDNDELVYDQIDPNIVYSVNSLNKHYVHREQFSLNDPNEGFLDLHCVKHIRQGCLDTQLYTNLQQIAANYAIANFDHSNIICIIYGSTFSENRSFYIIGLKNSIGLFYKALEFLLSNLNNENILCIDQRQKWLKDLYLNLFYDNANKRFQPPTPMQALLAFGGRQFNFNTLEHNFYSSISNLIVNCQSHTSKSTKSDSSIGFSKDDTESFHNPQIRIQRPNNMENFSKLESKC